METPTAIPTASPMALALESLTATPACEGVGLAADGVAEGDGEAVGFVDGEAGVALGAVGEGDGEAVGESDGFAD